MAANFVGTDRSNNAELGNTSHGIDVEGSSGNQLGPGNRVTDNGEDGIHIDEDSSQNRIVANYIYDNLGRGIALEEGANGDLNSPTLASATLDGATTTVEGSIAGVPNGGYFVEFFVNAGCDPSEEGEGASFVTFASVTASGGTASFSQTLGGLEAGDVVTATLTGAATNNTSEFSNCATVAEGEPLPEGQEPVEVTATDDNPADATLDLYLDCGSGKPKQVIAVGLRPDSVGQTTARWSTNYDSTLAPANCSLQAVVMDGFTRSGFTATGTETVSNGPNPLVAAISNVRQGTTVLQYGLIRASRGRSGAPRASCPEHSCSGRLHGPGITRDRNRPDPRPAATERRLARRPVHGNPDDAREHAGLGHRHGHLHRRDRRRQRRHPEVGRRRLRRQRGRQRPAERGRRQGRRRHRERRRPAAMRRRVVVHGDRRRQPGPDARRARAAAP